MRVAIADVAGNIARLSIAVWRRAGEPKSSDGWRAAEASNPERPHVVVLGGGFAGLAAVRRLRHADVDITLVDRNTYSIFQPLLYQVATATLNPGDISWFLRAVRSRQRNVRFLHGTITGINAQGQTVLLDEKKLTYDYLVVAVGATTNFFGIPGAAEHALPLYRRSQALAVRDAMFAGLEEAAASGRPRVLRVVVVGGGPTGVETAGAFAELRNLAMPTTYPELDPGLTHITLVERLPHVLASFSPRLRSYAQRALVRRGVDLRLDTAVKEVHSNGVMLDGDEFLPADMVVWASGVTVHEDVSTWGLPQGRGGRIRVDDRLRVQGMDRVFAIGDVATEDGDRALPQLAPPAIQHGAYVARAIAADQRGRTLPRFSYHDKGILATIGSKSAVAQIHHLPGMTGAPAWAVWMLVHLHSLFGQRNRLAAMVNLAARYLFFSRSHNVIVGETPQPRRADPPVTPDPRLTPATG